MSQKRKRSYTCICRCVVCNNQFRAARTDAKYCSGKCRKRAQRNRAGQRERANLPHVSQMKLSDLETLLTREQINARIDRLFS